MTPAAARGGGPVKRAPSEPRPMEWGPPVVFPQLYAADVRRSPFGVGPSVVRPPHGPAVVALIEHELTSRAPVRCSADVPHHSPRAQDRGRTRARPIGPPSGVRRVCPSSGAPMAWPKPQ